MSNLPALPEGFQWDGTPPLAAAPSLPDGFQWEGTPPGPAPTWADSAKDAAQTALPALARGVTGLAGLPGDINSAITGVSGKIANLLGADPAETAAYNAKVNASPLNVLPTSKGINDFTGVSDLHEPTTGIGKAVDAVGQMVPAAAMGPGGLLRNLARFAVVPGVVSETAGQIADKATSLPDWAAPAIRAATAVAASSRLPFRAISPNPAAPERAAMVNTLNNEGVTGITAGQRTGSRGLKWTESVLADTPFSGHSAEAINTQAGEQFTGAALRRAGITAPRATPDVMDAAFNRIGGDFDRLGANNRMEGDTQLGTDLQAAWHNYASMVNPSARAPIIEDTIRDIGNAIPANGGALPGATYQALRSRLAAAARGSNDPQLSHALSNMTEGLDDAMERSIARNNPADVGQFDTARRQYRNMLVLERAAGGAGEQAAGGLITPAALASATKQVQGARAFVRGQGDFAELARAGQGVMLPLPQSGTQPRENVMHNLQLAGILAGETGVGAAAGAQTSGSKEGTALGAAGGIAVPAILGRVLMSRPGQRYMGNQVAARVPGLLSTPQGQLMIANELRGLLSSPHNSQGAE